MSIISTMGTPKSTQARITFALATIVTVILLAGAYLVSPSTDEKILSVAIIALGVSVGMIAGTALSPSDETETKRFTTFGQALMAFVGGYLASKMDTLINSAIASDAVAHPTLLNSFRLIAFTATLLVVGKATFSCRSYDRQQDHSH